MNTLIMIIFQNSTKNNKHDISQDFKNYIPVKVEISLRVEYCALSVAQLARAWLGDARLNLFRLGFINDLKRPHNHILKVSVQYFFWLSYKGVL